MTLDSTRPTDLFVTVGTHEDPFERLVAEADRLAGAEGLRVQIQSGYSRHVCRHAEATAMMSFDALQSAMARARIVVTHGGPASIMQAFAHGKVPVVVPRQSRFGEHVDDHQVRFARRLADRLVVVEDIGALEGIVRAWPAAIQGLSVQNTGPERARAFALRLDALCERLVASSDARPARGRWRAVAPDSCDR